jgi:maltose alpha-D-glucosyltransferase/alpha-amylase
VRAYCDSNGDGVGDFRGLLSRLDYLQDLGVTALWLLPFYPSPGRDDGYDIASYRDIHPRYGSLADFKAFLTEAHRRNLRVITELVINHTSDQHPWFQRARQAPPGHPDRDYYVWSDTDQKYREARIIFKDFEASNWTWDPLARAYYWHRFYSHQPDLNYDNPRVWKAVFDVMDFWLDMGIDGLRLDAIPYLYERDGTNCENLPETHAFLRALRKHVDDNHASRMLLAEANQWPEDSVAYFGQGDECHMAFHFPVMPRLFMAIRMEDRLPITDILAQTPAIPDTCQWAMFLRNHDELTLEMVTDEDRDYMYRVYARDPQARINLGIRRRLAPLLENHRAKIELMNGLLFSLPGAPVLYYGDEIGMGDNIYLGDRNGVRTPMQWTADRNAGFSRANPQGLYLPVIIDPEYHYEAVNVEVQQNNPHSLLWWMKRLIDLRKRHRAFSRGTFTMLSPGNHKVLAFVRSLEGPDPDHILVVANLSRFTQYVQLDLGGYASRAPVELMGRTVFPPIGEQPYLLTLGPYAFYWFALEPQRITFPSVESLFDRRPTLEVSRSWENVFKGAPRERLQEWLALYLPTCPWFAPHAAPLKAAIIQEAIPVPVPDGSTVQFALVQAEYSEGDPETYVVPIAFAEGMTAERICMEQPQALIALLQVKTNASRPAEPGVLYDPLGDAAFSRVLLEALLRHRLFRRSSRELQAVSLLSDDQPGPNGIADGLDFPARNISVYHGSQHHTSIHFGDRYVLKVYRRVEEGTSAEVEVGRFVAQKEPSAPVAPLLGYLEYHRERGEPTTLAVLHRYVPHQSDGWDYCQDALGRYFEQALMRNARGEQPAPIPQSVAALLTEEIASLTQEAIGAALEMARQLGQRMAELHLILAAHPDDPTFAKEPFTSLYQRSLYQSVRSQIRQTFVILRKRMESLPESIRPEAQRLEGQEEALLQRGQTIHQHKIAAGRIRCHGDANLREVLYTGKDFVFIDFEGIPTRPLSDRRRKYTPLRDVACMMRSFHYVSEAALRHGVVRHEDQPVLAPWARLWAATMGQVFWRAYWETASKGDFLPEQPDSRDLLLDFYLLKRALMELRHELTRPGGRVDIPVQGLLHVLELGSVVL